MAVIKSYALCIMFVIINTKINICIMHYCYQINASNRPRTFKNTFFVLQNFASALLLFSPWTILKIYFWKWPFRCISRRECRYRWSITCSQCICSFFFVSQWWSKNLHQRKTWVWSNKCDLSLWQANQHLISHNGESRWHTGLGLYVPLAYRGIS